MVSFLCVADKTKLFLMYSQTQNLYLSCTDNFSSLVFSKLRKYMYLSLIASKTEN